MQNELITEASKLFPTIDHWHSFLELAAQKDAIKDYWFTDATTRIRRHFMMTLNSDWGFEPFGSPNRDTRWFIKDYGPQSLALSYSNFYRFDLRIWDQQNFKPLPVTNALKTSKFGSILRAFGRIDRQGEWGSELIEMWNFSFDSYNSGQLSDYDLAWFAAHEIDIFVDQAIKKIEQFTNSSEVTEALRQLNQTAKDSA